MSTQTTEGKDFENTVLLNLEDKFKNIDWQWTGDGEWDERRLEMTLYFDPDNRDKKREFLLKMISAEGYGA